MPSNVNAGAMNKFDKNTLLKSLMIEFQANVREKFLDFEVIHTKML